MEITKLFWLKDRDWLSYQKIKNTFFRSVQQTKGGYAYFIDESHYQKKADISATSENIFIDRILQKINFFKPFICYPVFLFIGKPAKCAAHGNFFNFYSEKTPKKMGVVNGVL